MSWHYLQGEEAVYWPDASLDGAPSALSKMIPEPGKSSLIGSVMGHCHDFQYGMMSEHLMEHHGAGMSTSSHADSHARTLPTGELVLASRENDRGCGRMQREPFAILDPNSSSWKTPQTSLFAGWDEFCENWPQWGWMRNGECFELRPLEHATIDPGFSWLLTPTANSWRAWTFTSPKSLIRTNHADGNLQERLMRLYQRMTTPRCQEILMFWPEGWTDSKPLGMDGFHQWQLEQSKFC